MKSRERRWWPRAFDPESDEPDDTPPTLVRCALGVLWEAVAPMFLVDFLLVALGVPMILLAASFGLAPALIAVALVWFPGLAVLIGIAHGRLATPIDGDRQNALGALRRSWWRVVVLGLLMGGLVMGSVVMLTAARQYGGAAWLVWSFQLGVLAVFLLVFIHTLPLLATRGGSLRTALRNGLALAALNPLQTVGILGLMVLLGAMVAFIGLGVLLAAPLILASFLAANTWLAVNRQTGG